MGEAYLAAAVPIPDAVGDSEVGDLFCCNWMGTDSHLVFAHGSSPGYVFGKAMDMGR